MKRMQKKVLGLSGLVLVAAMTVCAAAIPSPGASATTSITDTITVRVVGDTPSVDISTTKKGTVSDPKYEYAIEYENASKVSVYLDYSPAGSDEAYSITLLSMDDVDYYYGTLTKNISVRGIAFNKDTEHPAEEDFGTAEFNTDDVILGSYGRYKLTVEAIAYDGTPYYDYLIFEYVPVQGSIDDTDPDNTITTVDEIDDDVARVEVKTKNGTIVGRATREELEANDMKISLDLDDVGCQEKLYLYSYDASDDLLSPVPYVMTTECPEIPDTGTPDTGGLFQNLDISKEDYLVTGLIIFFVIGIVGFGIVARSQKSTRNRKRH